MWRAVAGPSESWLVTPYDSHRSWSRDASARERRARPAALAEAASSTTILATLREDLSFRPHGLSAKHFSVTIVATRPGHATDYGAERRIVRAAHEKAGIDERYSIYQVTAGLQVGTFLMFLPYDDLGDLDGVDALHGARYEQALSEEDRRRSRELIASGIAESTVVLFSVDAAPSVR